MSTLRELFDQHGVDLDDLLDSPLAKRTRQGSVVQVTLDDNVCMEVHASIPVYGVSWASLAGHRHDWRIAMRAGEPIAVVCEGCRARRAVPEVSA